MWQGRSYTTELPLNRYSECDTGGPCHGEQLPDKSATTNKVCGVNYATLQVHGMLGNDPIDFLVDSGAAVSVVTNDILPASIRTRIIREALIQWVQMAVL